MNKIGLRGVLIVLLFCIISTTVYGDIPNNTLIVRNRGYTLYQAHRIGEAVLEDNPIYIKDYHGVWREYKDNREVQDSIIPEVTMIDENGQKVVYEKGDGNIIEEESEEFLFILEMEKSFLGLGEKVSIKATSAGTGEVGEIGYYKIIDKKGNDLTDIIEIGEDGYIYPYIEEEKIDIKLYDISKQESTDLEDIDIGERGIDGRIFISKDSIKKDKVIVVNNIDEFIEAIGSNRKIVMKEGVYNLLESKCTSPNISKEGVYDGMQLIMKNVDNLIIEGEGAEYLNGDLVHKVELVVEPRYANVLTFIDCKNVELRGIRIGHTIEKGGCTGGVISLKNCEDISIYESTLYGCGTEGLDISDSKGVIFKKSIIEECSSGIAYITSSENILFQESIFRENEEYYGVTTQISWGITIENCVFKDNICGDSPLFNFSNYDESQKISVKGCDIINNSGNGLSNLQELDMIITENNHVEKNKFGDEKVLLIFDSSKDNIKEELQDILDFGIGTSGVDFSIIDLSKEEDLINIVNGEKCELVIGYGEASYDALQSIREQFPQLECVSIENEETKGEMNFIMYKMEEGAYLAGTIAAEKSETGIGIIADYEDDDTEKLVAGFISGVGLVQSNKALDIINNNRIMKTDGEDDDISAKVKKLIDKGCDYIFVADQKHEGEIFKALINKDKEEKVRIISMNNGNKEMYEKLGDRLETLIEQRLTYAVEKAVRDYKGNRLEKISYGNFENGGVYLSRFYWEYDGIIQARRNLIDDFIVPKTVEEGKEYVLGLSK